ncbi:MAG: hypothetical protein ABMA64_12830 [Myxococcota bacterium]
MTRLWWSVALAGGCGIASEDDYATALANNICKQTERCTLGFFESEYTSFDDCVGEQKDEIDPELELYQDLDCEYVPSEARECVNRIGGLSCEDWFEGDSIAACDLVYDCPDLTYGYTYGGSR